MAQCVAFCGAIGCQPCRPAGTYPVKRYRDLIREVFEEAAALSDDVILESGVEDFPLPRKFAKAVENVVRYAERNPQRLPKVGKYVGRAFEKGSSKESLGSALATVQVFVSISDSCSEHILVLESSILSILEGLLVHKDGKAHRMAAELYEAYSIALPIVYENGPPRRIEALAQRFLDNVMVRDSRGPVDSQINSKAASLQAIAAYLRLLARQRCPWQSQSLSLSAAVQTVVRSVSEGPSNANSDILDKFGDSAISELCKLIATETDLLAPLISALTDSSAWSESLKVCRKVLDQLFVMLPHKLVGVSVIGGAAKGSTESIHRSLQYIAETSSDFSLADRSLLILTMLEVLPTTARIRGDDGEIKRILLQMCESLSQTQLLGEIIVESFAAATTPAHFSYLEVLELRVFNHRELVSRKFLIPEKSQNESTGEFLRAVAFKCQNLRKSIRKEGLDFVSYFFLSPKNRDQALAAIDAIAIYVEGKDHTVADVTRVVQWAKASLERFPKDCLEKAAALAIRFQKIALSDDLGGNTPGGFATLVQSIGENGIVKSCCERKTYLWFAYSLFMVISDVCNCAELDEIVQDRTSYAVVRGIFPESMKATALEDLYHPFTTRIATEAFRDLRVLSENAMELEVNEAELRKLVQSSAVTRFQLPSEIEIFHKSYSVDGFYSKQTSLDRGGRNFTTDDGLACSENNHLPWVGEVDEDTGNEELSNSGSPPSVHKSRDLAAESSGIKTSAEFTLDYLTRVAA